MQNMGFPISQKENENRRVLLPTNLKKVKYTSHIYIEQGYGELLGYSDQEYEAYGCNVMNRDAILSCDIICDPKIGDAEYLSQLKEQVIFGWVHAVQNKKMTDILVKNKLTAFAWEDMFDEERHIFWKNNEITGEAAIYHAFLLYGKLPKNIKVAVLGRGNTAKGAVKMLTLLGANVTIYNRKMEQLFQTELHKYDVIVNAILWDTARTDHIINKKDLKRMRKGSLIIDISCDQSGGIETSIPTTINNPTYLVNDIVHYVVDHTPSLFYKTVSENLGNIVSSYIDLFITNTAQQNPILSDALIVNKGIITDPKISIFQNR